MLGICCGFLFLDARNAFSYRYINSDPILLTRPKLEHRSRHYTHFLRDACIPAFVAALAYSRIRNGKRITWDTLSGHRKGLARHPRLSKRNARVAGLKPPCRENLQTGSLKLF